MKAVKLTWKRIDWDAFWGQGYNYIKDKGVIYATTVEIAKAKCPITEEKNNTIENIIEIEEITIEEEA